MRRSRAKKRKVAPDPRYQSVALARFINYVMQKGKKSVAQKVVYNAFDYLKDKEKTDPMRAFEKAIKNVGPVLEIRARRIGGANYQIPVEVRGERKQALAFRWIIEAANKKRGKPMHVKLAGEILDATKGQGGAMKKRSDVHKMAEANKAFAHFA